jgi:hypothetical protein
MPSIVPFLDDKVAAGCSYAERFSRISVRVEMMGENADSRLEYFHHHPNSAIQSTVLIGDQSVRHNPHSQHFVPVKGGIGMFT